MSPNNLFYDRDVHGNESDTSNSESEDYEDPLSAYEAPTQALDIDIDEDDVVPPIQIATTARKRAYLSGNVGSTVRKVLDYMDTLGIDLPILLDAVSWGNADCIQDKKVIYERGALLHSVELPTILHRWFTPPQLPGSKHKRPHDARQAMQNFATECVKNTLNEELEALGPHLTSPAGEDIHTEKLTGMGFAEVMWAAEEQAPNMLHLVKTMATRPGQQENTQKDSEKNKGKFGSRTAATIYIKPDATSLPATANSQLKITRAEGLKNPLTELDILDLAQEAQPKIQAHSEYQVLWLMLENPEFDLQTYPERNDEAFLPPPPIDRLPAGPEHMTLQYLLGTVNIAEASYEDHERLIDEWFAQLGWNNLDEQIKLAMHHVVAWVGDQLTMDHLCGLFQFRAEDENSYERLNFMILVFGWLHLEMAFSNSLHKQYLGTSGGHGLRQAFDLLE
ncbi:hypothetical protein H0H92_001628 [Tricholoma furcatifolium]|nr:hypothetical protein H0H92_001628 [Tricholoma furcatifolium]